MNIEPTKNYFKKNSKPYFLISGEIHYFRLDQNLWEKHLQLLKETGANTTSTYIPWDWHEYEEGKFDFNGSTIPSRNLIKYIELCKKVGLDLIVKPGPYILAEYSNHGLPEWFIKKAKLKSHMLNQSGNVISPELMSYLSDEFMDYTFRWFDKIMPIIQENQITKGGPISMMQVCNEIGVFHWLSGQIDYNESVKKLFHKYLKEKYESVLKLNAQLQLNVTSFEQVNIPAGNVENRTEYLLYYEFHLFQRFYFEAYFNKLIDRIRKYGIDITLTHNIPGWIYGNAAEMPMLMTLYSGIIRKRSDLIFGLDHIPEYFSFRNAHSDLACNKILDALQINAPVWAAEFQAGTREHHVKNYAADMESFYAASLAHGLKGFNYYMFSQGENPNGKGYYGKTFYYQTPLNKNAETSELYTSTKKINNLIKKLGNDFLESKTQADVCVAFYQPYFYTEFISSQIMKEKKLEVRKIGLYIDPRFVREELFFNGLLRSLQTLNYNYDIKDLSSSSVEELLKYKQLWITTTEYMDCTTQKLLVEFLRSGGNLVIYPAVPTLDLYLKKCTVFKDEIGIDFKVKVNLNKVNAFGVNEVFTFLNEKQIYSVNKNQQVAFANGEVCGIKKQIGKGTLISLGFAFGYSSDEHLKLIEKILSEANIRKTINIADEDIQYVVRKSNKYAYLFFLNYHNEKKYFKLDNQKFTIKPFSYKIIKKKIKRSVNENYFQ